MSTKFQNRPRYPQLTARKPLSTAQVPQIKCNHETMCRHRQKSASGYNGAEEMESKLPEWRSRKAQQQSDRAKLKRLLAAKEGAGSLNGDSQIIL